MYPPPHPGQFPTTAAAAAQAGTGATFPAHPRPTRGQPGTQPGAPEVSTQAAVPGCGGAIPADRREHRPQPTPRPLRKEKTVLTGWGAARGSTPEAHTFPRGQTDPSQRAETAGDTETEATRTAQSKQSGGPGENGDVVAGQTVRQQGSLPAGPGKTR